MLTQEVVAVRKTALYDEHVAAGAKIVEFAGWAMPMLYAGIVASTGGCGAPPGCSTCRTWASSCVSGPDALRGARAADHEPCLARSGEGRVQYSAMCYENGGFVDDLLIYATAGAVHARGQRGEQGEGPRVDPLATSPATSTVRRRVRRDRPDRAAGTGVRGDPVGADPVRPRVAAATTTGCARRWRGRESDARPGPGTRARTASRSTATRRTRRVIWDASGRGRGRSAFEPVGLGAGTRCDSRWATASTVTRWTRTGRRRRRG